MPVTMEPQSRDFINTADNFGQSALLKKVRVDNVVMGTLTINAAAMQ